MLDRLFHADRGSLLTELMTGVISEFAIDCSRLHNDSTSVSVHGAYQNAGGEDVAGPPAPAITPGHSKDYRPDLKQLVVIRPSPGTTPCRSSTGWWTGTPVTTRPTSRPGTR